MSQPNPSGLNETDRRHYLSAMGIRSWYPRVRLPAAPDPILFDLDDTEVPAATPASATAVETDAPMREPTPPTPGPTPSPGSSTPPPAPETPTPATPPPRAQSAPVPRFALSLSVVGDLIIADSLAKGLEQPTPAGQQLLLNILAGFGVTGADVRMHHVIQWPLFTNPRVDQSVDQARIYVDEKLDQFIRQFEPRRLLSFGAVMPRLQGWEQPQGEYNGLPWVGLPSLYRMLADPKQKAVTWHRLRPLIETP